MAGDAVSATHRRRRDLARERTTNRMLWLYEVDSDFGQPQRSMIGGQVAPLPVVFVAES